MATILKATFSNFSSCRKFIFGFWLKFHCFHYTDVIMGTIASQITSLTIVYSTVYSGADQRKHQSSASLAFVRGVHRRPVNSTHKWPVTRKMFPFDDVIMFFKCPIYSKPALVEMAVWRRSDDGLLFESMMALFTDSNMYNPASVSKWCDLWKVLYQEWFFTTLNVEAYLGMKIYF